MAMEFGVFSKLPLVSKQADYPCRCVVTQWGYIFLKEGVHFTQGGTLNGRPILTHGVSTSWTNKISLRRGGRTTQELAPLRPSDAKQKPHKCHSMVKFQGMDIGRQLDSVNRMLIK